MASPAAWLAPAVPRYHRRIAIVGTTYLASAAIAVVVIFILTERGIGSAPPELPVLLAGVVLVAISVFAPQAIFRTHTESATRHILDNPAQPISPWRRATVSVDMVLVGAIIGSVFVAPILAFALFASAFLLRVFVLVRATAAIDPNARYHQISEVWNSAATAAIAYALLQPFTEDIALDHQFWPVLYVAVVATIFHICFTWISRWAEGSVTWRDLRNDLLDARRLLIAAVIAGIAWLITVVGMWMFLNSSDQANPVLPVLVALSIFLLSWLILWIASIRVWHSEARRTLRMWRTQQVLIAQRLADGSMDPALAVKAAAATVTRIAAVVFGAGHARTLAEVHGDRLDVRVDAGRYANAQQGFSARTTRLDLGRDGEVIVADCLLPGRFMLTTSALVLDFTESASLALHVPELAWQGDGDAEAFTAMFDGNWPGPRAFERAVARMRERFDAHPHLSSLVLGVFSINEFAAITGGVHEQAAISHVVRSVLTSTVFRGADVFVAYERPGRIWLAVSGGPIIRNAIQGMRDVQESLNTFGRAGSSANDLDIFVSVSFGYAALQVDDVTYEGLIQSALDRLATDQAARNPLAEADFSSLDTLELTPELFTRTESTPVTVENLYDGMLSDRGTDRFRVTTDPIITTATGASEGVLVNIGWERQFRHFDMRSPGNLLKAVERQPRLAALAAQISIDAARPALGSHDHVMVRMPAILLHPEAGEFSLPNLIVPALDRTELPRTIVLVDDLPVGSGQTLAHLADRGVRIALTATAAAAAEARDLQGWTRSMIVFPTHVLRDGIDVLTIRQTASAVAGPSTRFAVLTPDSVDVRMLAGAGISAVIDSSGHADARVRDAGIREQF